MNKGDTNKLCLDFWVNGVPIEEEDWDEIEFYFDDYRFTLTDGTVFYDDDLKKFCVIIDQEKSFKAKLETEFQIRLRQNDDVISSDIRKFKLGKTISREII